MGLDSDIELLSQVALFQGFLPDQLRLLAFGTEARTLTQDTKLYREGSFADGGYVIAQGAVTLTCGLYQDQALSYGRGALISEMALITETFHAATAVASEHTKVLKISRPLFHRILSEYPQLAALLHQRISQNVDQFIEQLNVLDARLNHANTITNR